jgi:hypothetical protein
MNEGIFCDVMPLEPPFEGEIVTLRFIDTDKLLAITLQDHQRIVAMFGTDLTERTVTMSRAPDNKRIRIEPIKS